jgi:hypothetical protein
VVHCHHAADMQGSGSHCLQRSSKTAILFDMLVVWRFCSKRSALTIYLLIVCAGLHLQPNGTEVMTGIQGQLVRTPVDPAWHQCHVSSSPCVHWLRYDWSDLSCYKASMLQETFVFLNGRLLRAPLRKLDTFVFPQGLTPFTATNTMCKPARSDEPMSP